MEPMYSRGHNQLAVIQRWPAYSVEPGYFWDTTSACLFSKIWSLLRHNQLVVSQKWPTYIVEPVYYITYSDHPWGCNWWAGVYTHSYAVVIS